MYCVTLRQWHQEWLQSPFSTSRKYILLIHFTFLVESLHPSFQYSLVIYICIYIAVNFTKSKLMAGSVPVLNLPEKCINPASKNISVIIFYLL